MIFRFIAISVWICFVTLGSTYAAFSYRLGQAQAVSNSTDTQPVAHDLKTITVPVIRDGQVRGYISADFSIIVQEGETNRHMPDIDGYVIDESYRFIYSDTSIAFDAIRKTDLTQLTSDIKSRVNARLGRQTLQDVLVRGYHYIPRDQLPK